MDTQKWLPAADAARLAQTEVQYLYKLRDKGELNCRFKQVGKLKKWEVDTSCPRFQKLLSRLMSATPAEETDRSGLDWVEWEAMARRAEEVTRKTCTDATIQNYTYRIKKFFKTYPELNRDTLRAALAEYERLETIDRDYYTSKEHTFLALMSVARWYAFRDPSKAELVESLKRLRPRKKLKGARKRWHDEETILEVVKQIQTATSKRKNAVYSDFNKALNVALVLMAFYTGARASEICNVRLQDIDWKERSVRLFGKGGKERWVGMPGPLVRALRDYRASRPKPASETEAFFLADTGTPLNKDTLGRRFRRAGKWAGVIFAPHDARRTAITWMLTQKHLPVTIVRDAVGHSSLATTNRYAQPSAKDVIAAMRELA